MRKPSSGIKLLPCMLDYITAYRPNLCKKRIIHKAKNNAQKIPLNLSNELDLKIN